MALSWLWIYLTGQRSARLITQGDDTAVEEDKTGRQAPRLRTNIRAEGLRRR